MTWQSDKLEIKNILFGSGTDQIKNIVLIAPPSPNFRSGIRRWQMSISVRKSSIHFCASYHRFKDNRINV